MKRSKQSFLHVSTRVTEAVKFNLLTGIEADWRLQTVKETLIEFTGSELRNHQQVNSRKQILSPPAGNFTDCISAWFDVFTYSSRWGAGRVVGGGS